MKARVKLYKEGWRTLVEISCDNCGCVVARGG